jgi:hypothetical protein
MNTKLLTAILFSFLGIMQLSAQQSRNLEWGKIPEAEKKMTVYSADSSADAVVLNANYELYFVEGERRMVPVFTAHKRIKILKESALDKHGDLEIPYYSGNSGDNITKLMAQVIQPNGSITEIDKKSFITEKTTQNYSTRKCAFPNLKVGSIIEYQYTIELASYFSLRSCHLQGLAPVRHAQVLFSMPDIYEYVYLSKGYQLINKKQMPNSFNTFFGHKCQIFNTFLYADNLPGLEVEKHITTMDDYTTQVKFQLKSYTNFGDSQENKVMNDWRETAKSLQENSDFGGLYLKKNSFKNLWATLSPIVERQKTETDKAQVIYDYLNKNIKASDYGIWSMSKPDELLEKKAASFGELNIMLLACLREAGIKADAMLISTRSNGLPIKAYPIVDQFNHVLCYAMLDGKAYTIDAGNELRPLGMLRIDALNHDGWIMDKENPRWIPIEVPPSNNTIMATLNLQENGNLKGTINSSDKGYAAMSWREIYNNDNDGKHKDLYEELEDYFAEIKIDSINTVNLENLNETFKHNLYCTIPQAATIANDLIYLNPCLMTEFDENPFKQPKRNLPIDISFPIKNQFILNLSIPEAYVVDELPKSVSVSLPNNAAKYSYAISNTGNNIQLAVKLDISQIFYEPENYPDIQQFFTHIADKQAEQIVLKRKK